MKTILLFIPALALLIAAPASFSAEEAKAKPSEAESLFNGKDLTGWDGDPALWSVKDGMIVGKSNAENPLPHNKFLIWSEGEVEDFVLTVKLRVIGDNNSGIQYRSKMLPEAGDHVVGGYQCDIHPTQRNHGMLYHEKGRGICALRGMVAVITPDGKKLHVKDLEAGDDLEWGDWHTYEIRAIGNRLVHTVNGQETARIYDLDEEGRALKGLVAFQLHRGNPMEVHIKDVRLQTLPKGDVLGADEVKYNADSPPVMPPKKPRKPKAKS